MAEAVANVKTLCKKHDIDLDALWRASGFEFISKRDQATELLIADPDTRSEFMTAARQARKLFKAVLPDPAAAKHQADVAVIRELAEHITSLGRVEYDLEAVSDAVDELLDRSVGAEEYIIRTAAEGEQVDHLIDLSKIDFEGLAEKFGNKKRAETERLAALLKVRAERGAKINPTRIEFVERMRRSSLTTTPGQ